MDVGREGKPPWFLKFYIFSKKGRFLSFEKEKRIFTIGPP